MILNYADYSKKNQMRQKIVFKKISHLETYWCHDSANHHNYCILAPGATIGKIKMEKNRDAESFIGLSL